ncbi:MAG: sarcosine oxidase subunit delta [Acidimicrobiales bacterium]
MILVPCPECGPRDASEFHASGRPRARPDPDQATPAQWRAYLYTQPNPAGWTAELWFHRAGCRRYLVVQRHTVTDEIRCVRPARSGG